MDDDLDGEGRVEVGLGHGGGVVVVQHLREVPVVPGKLEATPLLMIFSQMIFCFHSTYV